MEEPAAEAPQNDGEPSPLLKINQFDSIPMSLLYFPKTFSKDKSSIFIFYCQISITCFGFRPDHMVSDVLLIPTKYQHQKTSIKNSLFVKTPLSLFAKKVKLCPHKTM